MDVSDWEKTYIDSAWKLLGEDEKKELLLQYVDKYQPLELSLKFKELGGEYAELEMGRETSAFSLGKTGYNSNLIEKLKDRGYVSHVNVKEDSKTGTITIHGRVKTQ